MDVELEVRPGDVLAGKYRVESLIGQGGMGVVVSATHVQLEERVAIKFLLPTALSNPEAVARFSREARAAVKIKSEHVARVIDVGTLETGCPYMVMEYLHGRDLGALVHQRGAVPIEDAVEYVLQASEAIAEAHALGIIHRDLKPQNLFLAHRADGSACVKVLDFGISKVTGLAGSGSDLGMTKTTAVMGSPLYMSPEQMASSRDVDARTDIWALGAILYELLTGRVPFMADTMPQLCAMILQQPAPPLRNLRPDAPESLQNVLLRSLEKDPGKRYGNVAEFAHALLPYAPRSGRTSVERISRVLTAAGMSTSQLPMPSSRAESLRPGHETQSNFGQTLSGKSRAPIWIAVGVGVLAIGGAAAALLLRSAEPPAARESDVGAAAAPSTATKSSEPESTSGVRPAPPALAPPSPSTTPPSAPKPAAVTPKPLAVTPKPPASPAKPQVAPKPLAVTPPPPARPANAPPPAKKPVDLYSDRK